MYQSYIREGPTPRSTFSMQTDSMILFCVCLLFVLFNFGIFLSDFFIFFSSLSFCFDFWYFLVLSQGVIVSVFDFESEGEKGHKVG